MSLEDAIADVLNNRSILRTGAAVFTLQVPGVSLRVVRFAGRESISELFEFRIEVAGDELDPEALVGQPALLQLEGVESPRQIHGQVCEAGYIGQSSTFQLYELVIAPRGHELRHRAGARIFQDSTTEQIITEVLTRAGLDADWFRFALAEQYAPRNYCVQYRETDLAFISRLMEEDGIFYFFEHFEDRHVWVMADNVAAHEPIAGTPAVWFKPRIGSEVQDREHVHSFRVDWRTRSGKVTLRDKNLHHPWQKMEVEATARSGAGLEVYEFPGDYQHPGRGGPELGDERAKIRLEALQATRRLGLGASDCVRLLPGRVLELIGHPRIELDGEYRLLRVDHVGEQPQALAQEAAGETSYSNTFECTELKVPYRAPNRTPRPMMRGLQTAVVVGPEGEEVHVDEHGRVRVQFHWDREGAFNETSTCWVRVAQLWAGNTWGAMFIPRVGHEVLVDFLEGDPDRPIVVGRIYHGGNTPPYPLPEQKTRSTIKSESSPGGGGFNELRFEDKKHAEEIFLHAQKDWNTVILHNLSESVGVNRSSSIGVNESVSVGKNRSVVVGESNSTVVGTTHSVTIVQPPPPTGPPPPPPIPPTGTTMSDKSYALTTGLATISVNGANVTIDATGTVTIHSVGALSIKSDAHLSLAGNSVSISGTTEVKVNGNILKLGGASSSELTSSGPTTVSGTPLQLNGPGLFAGRVTELAPAAITTGVALVVIGGASFPLPVVKLPDGTLQVGKNITVRPNTGRYPDFQNKVMRDLGVMSSTPAGAQRLANIENNPGGHNVNIREYTAAEEAQYGANNSLAYRQSPNGLMGKDADGNPVPGSGSSTDLAYNPNIVLGPPGTPAPPDATLFHEMGHADHNANGVNRVGDPMGGGWDNGEEWQTIQGGVNQPGGTVAPGTPVSPSENDYLGQRNFPYRRTDHGSGYSNPDGTPITP